MKSGISKIVVAALLVTLTTFSNSPSAQATQYAFSKMLFTPCGATGANGPTLSNCLAQSNYSSNSWTSNTSFFNITAGIQFWTVPTSGSYVITAAGAQGGGYNSNQGGKGVVETSTINLTEGQIIQILVGQQGHSSDGSHGSGGGGTFVVATPYNTNSSILMIAGGGGGYGSSGGGANMAGQTAQNPTSTSTNAGLNGGGGASAESSSGRGGNGFVNGTNAGGSLWAAGGGGFGGNGGGYSGGSIAGPMSFINGGTGGPGSPAIGAGGFGGGGGAGDRGGGGGGYSGGGGGNNNSYGGDGGGSYITGTLQTAIGGANVGDGYVLITRYIPAVISVNIPSSTTYRTISTLTATSDSPGKITFYAFGKAIPGCKGIVATGSSSTYTATCAWKPSVHGTQVITAAIVPNNGNTGASASAPSSGAAARSNNR